MFNCITSYRFDRVRFASKMQDATEAVDIVQ